MSVYVDAPRLYPSEPRNYVGRTRKEARWCHMIADTEVELLTMATRLGLRREWIQRDRHRKGCPHFDLVPSKRALAVRFGAVPVTRREFVEHLAHLEAGDS